MSATPQTLNRLLARLDHTLLSSQSDPHLRTSQYERKRVGANIEYARTLLLTLERQSATNTRGSQAQRTELQQKREVIKRLQTRLGELEDAAGEENEDDNADDVSDDDDVDEDLLNSYAPARKDVDDGLETGEPQASRVDDAQKQTLRARRPLQASDNHSRASTSARETLFQARSPQAHEDPNLPKTEAMMSHNRTQQEDLTTGLLALAKQLKASSQNFQSSLTADRDVVAQAEGGLDKSAQGMEAAGKRMSMLRKMSEGQGWLGRIKLYGMILGLWLACFLLVFIGPKLRF